jgi:nucleoside-diphosphate-sugar epimerase
MPGGDNMSLNDRTVIVVTGANGFVGRTLLKRLQGAPARTIALTRYKVELPAKQIIPEPLNLPSCAEALRKADYVVHLAGTLFPVGGNSYRAANVQTTEAIVNPLKEGRAKRVLFLSYVGAREDSKNPYLQTKALAENLLKTTRKEVVVFRCTHIIGSPESPGPLAQSLLAKPGKKAGILGTGQQIVAPLYIMDVADALIAAMQEGIPGIYELAGPQKMSMDDLARLLNRNLDLRLSHLPNRLAQALGFLLPMLPRPFVDVILQDSIGDSSRARTTFGLKFVPLRTIWK